MKYYLLILSFSAAMVWGQGTNCFLESRTMYRDGQKEAAMAKLTECIQSANLSDSLRLAAYLRLCIYYREQGDISNSLKWSRLAVRDAAFASGNFPLLQHKVLMDRARSLRFNAQLDSSIQTYELAASLISQLPDSLQSFQTAVLNNNLGLLDLDLGESARALGRFNTAISLLDSGEINGRFHRVLLTNVGQAHNALGDYDSVIYYCQEAVDRIQTYDSDSSYALVPAYNSIGIAHYYLGDHQAELRYFIKAKDVLLHHFDSTFWEFGVSMLNIGATYADNFMGERALVYYDIAEEVLAQAQFESLEIGKVYVNKGVVCFDLDSLTLAINWFKKAEKIFRDSKPGLLQVYNNLQSGFMRLEKYDSALFYIQKQADLLEVLYAYPHHEYIGCLQSYGDAYLALGERTKALAYYQKAIDCVELLAENVPTKGNPYIHMAEFYEQAGELERGLSYLQRALSYHHSAYPEFEATSWRYYPFPYLYELRRLFIAKIRMNYQLLLKGLDLALLDETLAIFEELEKTNQQIRKNGHFPDPQLRWLDINRETQEQAVHLAYLAWEATQEEVYLAKALNYAEHFKATLLFEELVRLEQLNSLVIPPGLRQEEERLRGIIFSRSEIVRELEAAQAIDSARLSRMKRSLQQAREAYDEVIRQLEENYPAYLNRKYAIPQVSIPDIQAQLAPDQALVSYFLTDSLLYLWYITKDKASLQLRPWTEEDMQHLHKLSFRGSPDVEPYTLSEVQSTSRRLADLLIEPLAIGPEIKQLVVIPHKQLSYLPFEALGFPPSSPYTYLIEAFQLGYAYSLELWLNPIKQKMGEYQAQLVAFAPLYPLLGDSLFRSDTNRAVGGNPTVLFPLPYAQMEVEKVGGLMEGNIFRGQEATEANFKQYAASFPILHLAMHAQVDLDNPLTSKLYFLPDSEGTEDGLLHAYEIYSMRIQADMAVLSACNTAYGELKSGEGVMSLARAFHYAGCASMVVSLWQANDRINAQIMESFYAYLKEGMSKDAALRQAKLDFLAQADELQRHPYFWASMVAIGNMEAIKSRSSFPIYLGAAAMVIMFLLAYGVWRRRKPSTTIS